MISINEVRNTVMFFINKNNKGYITPDEFNMFSLMAQMDLYNEMFSDFNKNLIKKDSRLTNSGYADIPKSLEQAIDTFGVYTTPTNFTFNTTTGLWSYTGDDLFLDQQLSLVNPQGKKIVIDLVSKSELNYLVNSNMTSPTTIFPAYTKIGEQYKILPLVPVGYSVELFFIRKPKNPKWTYVNSAGNPLYNASATDLQNFEIDYAYLPELIVKILLYCGVSIREELVIQSASAEEIKTFQQNQ
ncbi:MAG TPA: hypothetical protein VIV55_10030 [Flavobacterium sp.]